MYCLISNGFGNQGVLEVKKFHVLSELIYVYSVIFKIVSSLYYYDGTLLYVIYGKKSHNFAKQNFCERNIYFCKKKTYFFRKI